MPSVDLVLALMVVAIVAWFVNTRVAIASPIKSIVNIVVALIVVGMVLWAINSYVPMAGSIKSILNVVVVVATCVFLLQAVGLWSEIVRLWNNLTKYRISH
jgi:hypothetical protein